MAFLDVRSDLAVGHEPLNRIMQAVADLSPDEPLDLVAHCEPVLLFRVLEARGYEHSTKRNKDGSWHITFRRLRADN